MKKLFFSLFIALLLCLGVSTLAPTQKAYAMSCGSSSGADGLYSACAGDTITHNTSGVKVTVGAYTDRFVRFKISGADISYLYLRKNSSRKMTAKNGTEIKLTYTKYSSTYGAFVQIATGANYTAPTPVPTPTVPKMLCGNSAGNDGLYSGCAGDSITHYPSGVVFTIDSYDSNAVILSSTNANVLQSYLYNQNQSSTLISNSGYTVDYKYTHKSDAYGVSIQIDSYKSYTETPSEVPTVSCGNAGGGDGLYNACLNDSITHDPSKIAATLLSYNDYSARLKLTNASTDYIYVRKDNTRTIRSNNGYDVTYSYTGKTTYGVFIKVSSNAPTTPNLSCGNSGGDDGVYRACIGDSITHYSSNIVAKVRYYDNYRLELDLSGRYLASIYLNKNEPYVVKTFGYPDVTFTYTDTSDAFGAMIKITTGPNAVIHDEYTFSGYVYNEDGSAVSGAKVAIAVNGTGQEMIDSYTDYNGYFYMNLALNYNTQYFIHAYGTSDYAGRKLTDYLKILDLNNSNQYFNNIRLYHPRQITFNYKYNMYGSNNINSLSTYYGSVSTNGGYSGFNIPSGDVTGVSEGSFYTAVEDGVTNILGNNIGQGGAVDLGYGSLTDFSSAPVAGYNRLGVELQTGKNYAVYDTRNNIYGIIHINSITIER